MRGILARPTVRFLFFLLILWGVVIPSLCPAHEAPNIIKFAVYPYKSPKSVIEVFGPIAARLEKKLGKKVQLVSAPDAQTFLAKGLAGEYDLALAGVTVYYKMLPAGYTPIAKGVPTFWGGVIVRQDSGITTIEQCKGKKIAAIGEHSYAGYMFFKALLDEKKIDSVKDLDIQFLGKVDTVIYGVFNKKYDAGLLRLDTLETPDFVTLKNQFRVIARSSEIPQFPFVVKSGMDQRTIAAIREVLTSLSPNKPEDLEI
ncbi:MAG: phosphate/phosphite/phosphonate ABC transporter substrate-binding protein, partial [Desulfurivibrionaceae bacterium]